MILSRFSRRKEIQDDADRTVKNGQETSEKKH